MKYRTKRDLHTLDVVAIGSDEQIEILGPTRKTVQRKRHGAEHDIFGSFTLERGKHLPDQIDVHPVNQRSAPRAQVR